MKYVVFEENGNGDLTAVFRTESEDELQKFAKDSGCMTAIGSYLGNDTVWIIIPNHIVIDAHEIRLF